MISDRRILQFDLDYVGLLGQWVERGAKCTLVVLYKAIRVFHTFFGFLLNNKVCEQLLKLGQLTFFDASVAKVNLKQRQ